MFEGVFYEGTQRMLIRMLKPESAQTYPNVNCGQTAKNNHKMSEYKRLKSSRRMSQRISISSKGW